MVEQLLAAGAALDLKTEVRVRGRRIGEGWGREHSSACPFSFLALCFSNFGVTLASRISKGIGHDTTV